MPGLEMSSCRSGEAGGQREAAAGEKSPREISQAVTYEAEILRAWE